MTYKLPPLPEPSWPFGSKYNGKDMQAYAIAAIEAQGVPDDADVWCEYVAEMVGAYISEPVGSEKVKAIAGIIRRRMPQRFFASAPPAPQVKQCEWTNCPTRVGEKCCNEQASGVQQEPVLVVDAEELRKLLQRPEGDKHIKAWPGRPISANEVALYTHPAQQAKPQPLSDEKDAK